MVERDTTSSSGNTAPIMIAVIVAVLVVIGLFVWQPWNQRSTSVTNGQTNSSTTTTQGTSSGNSGSTTTTPTKP